LIIYALNGKERQNGHSVLAFLCVVGFAFLLEKKLVATGVNFMLSGLDVCRQVRQAIPREPIKLLIFTTAPLCCETDAWKLR